MKINIKKAAILLLAGTIGVAAGTKSGLMEISDNENIISEEIENKSDKQETLLKNNKNIQVVKEEVVIDDRPLVYDEVNPIIKEYAYINKDASLYFDEEKTQFNETIEQYQLMEIYDYNDLTVVGKVNDSIGYIDINDIDKLEDIFVVVDISSQELKLYNNTEVILTTPVVTGTPTEDRHTEIGCFEVYDKTEGRWLKNKDGSDNVWVDTMMKFNGNQGLHDAEKVNGHNDYDKSHNKIITHHGWRSTSEFGGDTYLTNGSHGCINMLNSAAMITKEYVEEGTKVLVKQ